MTRECCRSLIRDSENCQTFIVATFRAHPVQVLYRHDCDYLPAQLFAVKPWRMNGSVTSSSLITYVYPNDADNDVEALVLGSRIFIAPHTIFLVAPECTTGGVHAPSACHRRICGPSRADRSVLDDSGVDDILERRLSVCSIAGGWCRFFN